MEMERRRVIFNGLGRREREVVEAYAAGLRNKDIAAKLGMSPKTVYTHKIRVMQKMGIDDDTGWMDLLVGVRILRKTAGEVVSSTTGGAYEVEV